MDDFARKLRERAAELGISNAEVARRCGLGERQYGYYVAGTRQPNLQALVKIADVLEVSVDALLSRADRAEIGPRDRLLVRLSAAARTLPDDTLTTIVVQVEALAAHETRGAGTSSPQP